MSGDIQISPHVGELFVKYGVRRQYRSGEVLLEKGALSAQAGFLVKGQLRTFCLGPSGDEISLFYLGPGNLFGSSALVYHAKVMVSVSAISPAEVYLLAADRFWKLWQEHGYPPQDLMAHFVRRITMLSDYICCSHFLEDDKRVAYFLHTCCASSGPSVHPRADRGHHRYEPCLRHPHPQTVSGGRHPPPVLPQDRDSGPPAAV